MFLGAPYQPGSWRPCVAVVPDRPLDECDAGTIPTRSISALTAAAVPRRQDGGAAVPMRRVRSRQPVTCSSSSGCTARRSRRGIGERLRGESLDGEFGPDAEELRSPPRDGDFRPHIGVGGELRRPRTLRHEVQDPSSGATSTGCPRTSAPGRCRRSGAGHGVDRRAARGRAAPVPIGHTTTPRATSSAATATACSSPRSLSTLTGSPSAIPRAEASSGAGCPAARAGHAAGGPRCRTASS